MTEPINPIVPRNPNIFPVPHVELPRIGEQDGEQRRREREEEEGGVRAPEDRREPQEQPEPRPRRRQQPPRQGDDGRMHVDVTA